MTEQQVPDKWCDACAAVDRLMHVLAPAGHMHLCRDCASELVRGSEAQMTPLVDNTPARRYP